MTQSDDHQLLAQFAREDSQTAFAALAERYVNLVYSAAFRQTNDSHAAEEITQAVFIILARKAASLGPKTILSGWLYQTARLTAANYLRTEFRRSRREQEAFMQSQLNEPTAEAAWQSIAPHLDAALGKLGDRDRNAIVLRFFENKSLSEVGSTLGASEAAAKMRVNRALEKLRKIFQKRGVTLTATLIAGAVTANSVQAAPVGMAVTATATVIKESLISTMITTTVEGTMKTMTWLKLKFAASVSVAAILIGSALMVTTSGNETPANPAQKNISSNQSKLLIKSFFVKTPTTNVAAIVKNLTKPAVQADPGTKALQDLIKQYSGVSFLGSPQITTVDGVDSKVSVNDEVKINGTNATVGISFYASPKIQSDSKITLEVWAELRELTAGGSPALQTTKSVTATIPLISGGMAFFETKIGTTSASTRNTQADTSETLLVFVSATQFRDPEVKNIKTR